MVAHLSDDLWRLIFTKIVPTLNVNTWRAISMLCMTSNHMIALYKTLPPLRLTICERGCLVRFHYDWPRPFVFIRKEGSDISRTIFMHTDVSLSAFKNTHACDTKIEYTALNGDGLHNWTFSATITGNTKERNICIETRQNMHIIRVPSEIASKICQFVSGKVYAAT